MKTKIAALCLMLLSSTCFAATKAKPAPPAPPACDRECLRGKVSEVLYGFVEHDISKLPVAPNLRVTEDARREAARQGRPRALGDQAARLPPGHHRRARGPGRRRRSWSRNPARRSCSWCGSRSTATQKISELELVTTRSRADGMIFNIDAYSGAPAEGDEPRAAARRSSPPREEAIEIAHVLPARPREREDLQCDRHAVRARTPIAWRTAR